MDVGATEHCATSLENKDRLASAGSGEARTSLSGDISSIESRRAEIPSEVACCAEATERDSKAAELSFKEVMALVQAGKPVPGVKELVIKESCASLTRCNRALPHKPWEE